MLVKNLVWSYVVSVFIGTKLCILIKFPNDTYIQPNFKTANEVAYEKKNVVSHILAWNLPGSSLDKIRTFQSRSMRIRIIK